MCNFQGREFYGLYPASIAYLCHPKPSLKEEEDLVASKAVQSLQTVLNVLLVALQKRVP